MNSWDDTIVNFIGNKLARVIEKTVIDSIDNAILAEAINKIQYCTTCKSLAGENLNDKDHILNTCSNCDKELISKIVREKLGDLDT